MDVEARHDFMEGITAPAYHGEPDDNQTETKGFKPEQGPINSTTTAQPSGFLLPLAPFLAPPVYPAIYRPGFYPPIAGPIAPHQQPHTLVPPPPGSSFPPYPSNPHRYSASQQAQLHPATMSLTAATAIPTADTAAVAPKPLNPAAEARLSRKRKMAGLEPKRPAPVPEPEPLDPALEGLVAVPPGQYAVVKKPRRRRKGSKTVPGASPDGGMPFGDDGTRMVAAVLVRDVAPARPATAADAQLAAAVASGEQAVPDTEPSADGAPAHAATQQQHRTCTVKHMDLSAGMECLPVSKPHTGATATADKVDADPVVSGAQAIEDATPATTVADAVAIAAGVNAAVGRVQLAVSRLSSAAVDTESTEEMEPITEATLDTGTSNATLNGQVHGNSPRLAANSGIAVPPAATIAVQAPAVQSDPARVSHVAVAPDPELHLASATAQQLPPPSATDPPATALPPAAVTATAPAPPARVRKVGRPSLAEIRQRLKEALPPKPEKKERPPPRVPKNIRAQWQSEWHVACPHCGTVTRSKHMKRHLTTCHVLNGSDEETESEAEGQVGEDGQVKQKRKRRRRKSKMGQDGEENAVPKRKRRQGLRKLYPSIPVPPSPNTLRAIAEGAPPPAPRAQCVFCGQICLAKHISRHVVNTCKEFKKQLEAGGADLAHIQAATRPQNLLEGADAAAARAENLLEGADDAAAEGADSEGMLTDTDSEGRLAVQFADGSARWQDAAANRARPFKHHSFDSDLDLDLSEDDGDQLGMGDGPAPHGMSLPVAMHQSDGIPAPTAELAAAHGNLASTFVHTAHADMHPDADRSAHADINLDTDRTADYQAAAVETADHDPSLAAVPAGNQTQPDAPRPVPINPLSLPPGRLDLSKLPPGALNISALPMANKKPRPRRPHAGKGKAAGKAAAAAGAAGAAQDAQQVPHALDQAVTNQHAAALPGAAAPNYETSGGLGSDPQATANVGSGNTGDAGTAEVRVATAYPDATAMVAAAGGDATASLAVHGGDATAATAVPVSNRTAAAASIPTAAFATANNPAAASAKAKRSRSKKTNTTSGTPNRPDTLATSPATAVYAHATAQQRTEHAASQQQSVSHTQQHDPHVSHAGHQQSAGGRAVHQIPAVSHGLHPHQPAIPGTHQHLPQGHMWPSEQHPDAQQPHTSSVHPQMHQQSPSPATHAQFTAHQRATDVHDMPQQQRSQHSAHAHQQEQRLQHMHMQHAQQQPQQHMQNAGNTVTRDSVNIQHGGTQTSATAARIQHGQHSNPSAQQNIYTGQQTKGTQHSAVPLQQTNATLYAHVGGGMQPDASRSAVMEVLDLQPRATSGIAHQQPQLTDFYALYRLQHSQQSDSYAAHQSQHRPQQNAYTAYGVQVGVTAAQHAGREQQSVVLLGLAGQTAGSTSGTAIQLTGLPHNIDLGRYLQHQ